MIELRWATNAQGLIQLQQRTRRFCVDAAGAFCNVTEWSEWQAVPIFPLYRDPPPPTPTLTDAEREAITWAIAVTARTYDDAEGGPQKREVLRALLARHGGER